MFEMPAACCCGDTVSLRDFASPRCPNLNLISTLPRKIPMNRATVLNRLRARKATMAQCFGDVDVAL